MAGLVIKVGGKLDSSFAGSLKMAERMARHSAVEMSREVGRAVKGVALSSIGVYSLEEAFRKTVESAKELVVAGKRLQQPIEELQVMRQAAKDNSVELGRLETAFEKLNVAREQALSGGTDAKKYQAAFQALGVSMAQLQNLPAAVMFKGPIAEKMKSINPEEVAGPLHEIFGRGFGDLIPVLRTDFDELGKKMRETGAIMDSAMAAKLQALGNEFELVGRIITAQLAPALLAMAEMAYKLSMKSGGKVAGAAGFWGGVYQNMIDAPRQAGFNEHGGRNIWKRLWYEIFENKGPTSALKTMSSAESPFDKNIEDFDKMLAAAADALKSQTYSKPKFKSGDDEKEGRPEHFKSNLTENQRIGAFAMSHQVAIVDVARQTNAKIDATNARLDRANASLTEIAGKTGGIPGFN